MKHNRTRRRNGGAATVLPLSYYNPGAYEPSANAGRDLLKAIPPLGIRPKIGGGRTRRRTLRRTTGGFIPTIMDGFVRAASKYVVPVALFSGYKLMTRKHKTLFRKKRAKKAF